MACVKSAGLAPFAEAFAAAGFVTLAFDYRHWGLSGGEPRELLSIAAQRDDYRTALAYVRALKGVDPGRIFAWGTSFSGLHILELAASEPTLAGAIAQNPIVDGLAQAMNAPLQGARLMALALLDRVGAWLGRPPRYLPVWVGVGELGVSSTSDSLRGLELLKPRDGQAWLNRITARSLLEVPFTRPVRRAKNARCPLLLVVPKDDMLCPMRPALLAAIRAPHGELYRSNGGHWDVYAGGRDHDNVVAVEVAFLTRHAA